MKLGIISDSHHYYDTSGKLHNLTIVAAQFDCWAEMFDEVVICAPLLHGNPPASHSPYTCNNIRLLPIENAGGNNLQSKLGLLNKLPAWWKALRQLTSAVDAVHIRCPNNISIPGLIACQRKGLLRQAVYTGSWIGHPGEAMSYRWQRFFLKHLFRGPVAVYGIWPNQPSHVVSSFSPSYRQADWDMETSQVQSKIERLRSRSAKNPVRLLTVGALNQNKNQQLVIHAVHFLRKEGKDVTLDVLGDGDQRRSLELLVNSLNLQAQVYFHGIVSQSLVREYYRKSDFVVQAPYSEGYGKVPVEAFFHGVLPILSDVDMSQQIVGYGERGRCFSQGDTAAIVMHIFQLCSHPEEMIRMIENGREFARGSTLEAWQRHLNQLLNNYWRTDLRITKRGKEICPT